jgi:uncharacterized damage-inducible protein DinB
MTPEQAATIFEFLLPQIEVETKTTRKVLAAVPTDKGEYSPGGKCMNCLELVSHIATVDVWFLRSMVKGEFTHEPTAPFTTPAEAVAYYDTEMPKAIEAVKSLTPEDLAKPVQFYAWTNPNVAYAQFMLKHTIHHRGQLSAYLRPMGGKVPAIYGGSADEPVEMATAKA